MSTHAPEVLATFSRILIATDFSSSSEMALVYATAIATEHHAKMSVVHVMHDHDTAAESQHERDRIESKLRELENSGTLQGIDHSIATRHGNLIESISNLVETEHIDLLVLGTHGRTGMDKVLFGSHAEEICRGVNCPVLTIGPNVPLKKHFIEHKKILYATDFMSGSLRAVPYILALASKCEAQLVMVHVIENIDSLTPDKWETAPLDAVKRLQNLIPSDSKLQIAPEMIARYGVSKNVILSVADQEGCDLIAMGTRPTRLPGSAAHIPWSTTGHVISHAHCPVLTVRG